ncbi:MAG TPA: hypothetical protein VG013_35630, partial [Gemmataceae bacterium]|nr:hypothetical protein [Gemmataceae bacterium]
VEDVLGKGSDIIDQDVPADLRNETQHVGVKQWRRWKGDLATVLAGLSAEGDAAPRATVLSYTETSSDGTSRVSKRQSAPLNTLLAAKPKDEPPPAQPNPNAGQQPALIPNPNQGQFPAILPNPNPAPPPAFPPPLNPGQQQPEPPPPKDLPRGDKDLKPLDPAPATVIAAVKATIDGKEFTQSQVLGGAFDREFVEMPSEGALLVGFDVGLGKFVNNDVIQAVRPIFLSAKGEKRGKLYGKPSARAATLKAKPGYAVGAINVKTGLGVDGFSVTFMQMDKEGLNPADSYKSDWVGGDGGGPETTLSGEGAPVIGLCGKENGNSCSGLGLVLGLHVEDRSGVADKKHGGKDKLKPLDADVATLIRDAVKANKVAQTQVFGGAFDQPVQEVPAEGALLVGFEVGLGKFFNNDVIQSVQPIFLTAKGEKLGKRYGKLSARMVRAKAKAGYAVGQVTTKTGLGLDGFSVTFMELRKSRLNPDESYTSDWLGGKGGGGETPVKSDGALVVGLSIKQNNDGGCTGLGLVYRSGKGRASKPRNDLKPPGAELFTKIHDAVKQRAVTKTAVHGGAFDPEFTDIPTTGALLVGFEVGLGQFVNNDVIKSIRPIWLTAKGVKRGKLYGPPLPRVVTLKAKRGYAVGEVTVKTGLGLDGLSVTFMQVDDDLLNPDESYESKWVGGMGGGGPTPLGAKGGLVVGIAGKGKKSDGLSGLGLVVAGKPR